MHRRLAALALVAALVSSTVVRAQSTQPVPPQQADVPAVKYDPKTGQPNKRFLEMHEKFVQQAKQGGINLLFLGDSITAGWGGQKEIWNEHFGKYNSANFGIGGDRTQHVLWRIENGELEGIKPKVIVLMIGTNNSAADPADEIAAGVEKIVRTAREKTGAKVLLLAVFPRGETPEKAAEQRAVIRGVNERIAKLDDGKNVRYLDLSAKFMNGDGTISKEIMHDYLHLTKKGYEIWAEALDAPLKEMMGE